MTTLLGIVLAAVSLTPNAQAGQAASQQPKAQSPQAPQAQQPPQQPESQSPSPPPGDPRDKDHGAHPAFTGNFSSQAPITGTVAIQGGGIFPDYVTVEAVCGGMPGGTVKTRGRFTVVANPPQHYMSPNPGTVDGQGQLGCEIRASLSGFGPATYRLQSVPAEGVDIGTLTLRPLLDVQGFSYSASGLFAPKQARKAFQKGSELSAANKLDKAAAELQKAVAIYPKYAAAWFELGTVLHRLKRIEGAKDAYLKSTSTDDKFMKPVLQLAMLSAAERKWPEVAELTGRVIRRNPYEYPQAYLYHAVASYNLGDPVTAERSCRRAIELDAPHRLPKAYHLLGTILRERRDVAGAVASYQLYLKYTPETADAGEIRAYLAQAQDPSVEAPPAP